MNIRFNNHFSKKLFIACVVFTQAFFMPLYCMESADGVREADVGTACYWDTLPYELQLTILKLAGFFKTYEQTKEIDLQGAVYSAMFSPSGKKVAIAPKAGGLCIWDTTTGKKISNV